MVAAPGCPSDGPSPVLPLHKKIVIAASIRLKSMVSCTITYFNTYTESLIKKKVLLS